MCVKERGKKGPPELPVSLMLLYFHRRYTLSKAVQRFFCQHKRLVSQNLHQPSFLRSLDRLFRLAALSKRSTILLSFSSLTKSFSVFCHQLHKQSSSFFLSVAASAPPPLIRLGCHQHFCCWKTVSGITCGAR